MIGRTVLAPSRGLHASCWPNRPARCCDHARPRRCLRTRDSSSGSDTTFDPDAQLVQNQLAAAAGVPPQLTNAEEPPPLVDQFEDDRDSETFVTAQGLVVEEVEEEEAKFDYLGETTEGNLHLVQRLKRAGMINVFGLTSLDAIYTVDPDNLQAAAQEVLDELQVPPAWPCLPNPERAVFCSRTLNLRSIKAIGYDMDYTLIHYDVNAWEGRAYEYGLETLRQQGLPVEGLRFDPDLVIRGLIMDKEFGNLIKVDRFGLVKRAMHGTRMMSWQEIREFYGREVVNLRNEGRWVFLNTLFSVSEAVMYMQLVDRLDQGAFSTGTSTLTYQGLYRLVAKALYRTHVEGKLKGEIIQAPERFVELDPAMAQTLLDQKDSGKMLLLITNSDYEYTQRMMAYAYDRFLPPGMGWRDLFDMVIVQARKPDFFNHAMSLYEVVTPDGLMRPVLAARRGGLYCGGSAGVVEKALGVEGDDILYVGDHIYTDAALAKINFRWRTALIVRELEQEVEALARGRPHRDRLTRLMAKKEIVGDLFNHLRLARQRAMAGRQHLGVGGDISSWDESEEEYEDWLGGPGGPVSSSSSRQGDGGAEGSDGGWGDAGTSHQQQQERAASGAGASTSSYDGSRPGSSISASVRRAGSRARGGSALSIRDTVYADDSFEDEEALNETLAQLLMVMEKLDDRIGPMLEQDGRHFNARWGYLSRAGLNDKSQLCRQIEKYADVYTSRVANFLRFTPYMYFRSPSQSLAHDRGLSAYYENVLAKRAAAINDGNDGSRRRTRRTPGQPRAVAGADPSAGGGGSSDGGVAHKDQGSGSGSGNGGVKGVSPGSWQAGSAIMSTTDERTAAGSSSSSSENGFAAHPSTSGAVSPGAAGSKEPGGKAAQRSR